MRSIKFPLSLVQKIFNVLIDIILAEKTIESSSFKDAERNIINDSGLTKGRNISKSETESNFKRKFGATTVPAGEDQKPMLEQCRDIVQNSYKEIADCIQGEENITLTMNSTTTVSETNNVTVSAEVLYNRVIRNFLKKSAACYLRFDDIQKLKEGKTI